MDFSKLDGLIPAVIQDATSEEVLMVGFMNQEALDRTRETGFATFFAVIGITYSAAFDVPQTQTRTRG